MVSVENPTLHLYLTRKIPLSRLAFSVKGSFVKKLFLDNSHIFIVMRCRIADFGRRVYECPKLKMFGFKFHPQFSLGLNFVPRELKLRHHTGPQLAVPHGMFF